MNKIFLCALAIGAFGCANEVDKIENHIDCAMICGRYQECVDADYDADGCEDRCEAMSDPETGSDPNGANECEACLDNRSCVESVFPCAAECVQFVP